MTKCYLFNFKFYLIVVIFASLFLFPSCKSEKKNSDILIEKRNGLIYKQGSDTPYTGIIKDTARGKLFEYNVKNGLKEGEFKVSSLNGHVEMAGNMSKDKNEGKWKYFFYNGKTESEGIFKNDTPAGKWVFYYESGLKREEGEYIKGKREGKWAEYDSTGKIKNYIKYSLGEEVKNKSKKKSIPE